MPNLILKIVKQKPPCDCCGEAPRPDLLAVKVEGVECFWDEREGTFIAALPYERALQFHAVLEDIINPSIQTTGPEL